MNKILLIALREFVATVFSKAFVIGLLVVPALIALGFVIMPRLFNSDFSVAGEVTVIDPTGQVAREMRAALPETSSCLSLGSTLAIISEISLRA